MEKAGIFVAITGIQGLSDSQNYEIVKELNLQIYSNNENFNTKTKGVKHHPSKIANPKIIAQFARAGWGSIWANHLISEHGLKIALLYPKYDGKDDPEILMNNLSIERFGLGKEIDLKNPKKSLEEAIKLAQNNNSFFNKNLKSKFKTLDGIDYIAKAIFNYQI